MIERRQEKEEKAVYRMISGEDIPFFAEVTAGGRITIPEEIRKIFEIRDGDAVFCRLTIVRKKSA